MHFTHTCNIEQIKKHNKGATSIKLQSDDVKQSKCQNLVVEHKSVLNYDLLFLLLFYNAKVSQYTKQ